MAAFVLGNGLSRNRVDISVLSDLGATYGCNALYRTHTPTVLVATDQPIARAIQDSGYSRKHRFYTRRPVPQLGGQPVPKAYYGFSSGPIAAAIAAMDFHSPIYLLGFDMGPNEHGKFNNIYAGTEFYKPVGSAPTYTGNWIRQLKTVIKDFPRAGFVRVMAETTEHIAEFNELDNFSVLGIDMFLDRINNKKDL